MAPVSKQKCGAWALQIAELAETMAHQIPPHVQIDRDLESQVLYFKLIRHSNIMRDVSRLLTANPEQRLGNVFILLRCMLEDFITIYYLKMKYYDRELIFKSLGENFYNRIKMMKETAEINLRFYNSSMEGLIPFDYVQAEKNRITANPENDNLFVDKKNFKLKRFPSPRDIFKELPVDDSTAANAPSIISWIDYSEYVHHSIVSARGDADAAVNAIKIRQLKSTMLYAYKIVEFVRERLIERTFPIQLKYNEELVDELTEGSLDATQSPWQK